jgi:G3E family GTPase
MALIPATILTGFLGSGKTTLLKRVLTEAHGQKIAVIENEFGEENIDNDILVSDTNEQIIQMSNGCICCTIREDLRATLQLLAAKRRKGLLTFDRIVIETTGLADPGPVAQTFFMDDEIAETFLLDSILTLVDAKHAAQQLNDRQEARRQVGFADQIFISKADLVSAGDLDALQHRLKHMNPRAPQKVVHFGEVALSEVFDLKGFNLNAKLDIDPDFLSEEGHDHVHGEHCDHPSHQHEHEHGEHCDHPSHDHENSHGHGHHHHHDDDVKSFVFRSERAFDPVG